MVRLRTLTPSIVVRIHAGHPAIFALPVLADFLSIDYRPVLRQEMWARANSAVLRRLGGDRHRPCQGGPRGCLRRSGMAHGSGAGALLRSEEHRSELQSLMRNPYAVFCLQKNNTH